MGNLLLIFVKWPEPGTVKTRLAQSVGNQEAAEIYRILVRRVLKLLTPLMANRADCSDYEAVTTWLLFAPPSREQEATEWLQGEAFSAGWHSGRITVKPQACGDLGNRLRVAFGQGFAAGFERVAAIGTDCVELDAGLLRESWRQLSGNCDLVFGPATDGGYYLVAMNCPEARVVFDDIPWSSGLTLTRSLEVAGRSGFNATLLEQLGDVDTIDDWQRV
ncbi:MAG: TIGR04282 family arsenosugar biosynthesis glycosyltransferase, partial [Verrucomicrobiales bacterium]